MDFLFKKQFGPMTIGWTSWAREFFFLEGRFLWMWISEMVLGRAVPWIVFSLLGWLILLGRLGCRLRGSGFIGFDDLDRRIADGGADVVDVEFEAAALLSRFGLPVALRISAGDDDPGPLADAGRDHVVRQCAVCDAADERGLAVFPFAVFLGAAGLRDPEGDDGFAAGRAFGFEVFDDVAHDGHGDLVDCRHGLSFLDVSGPVLGLILFTSPWGDILCAYFRVRFPFASIIAYSISLAGRCR